jgi:hypothetical protein
MSIKGSLLGIRVIDQVSHDGYLRFAIFEISAFLRSKDSSGNIQIAGFQTSSDSFFDDKSVTLGLIVNVIKNISLRNYNIGEFIPDQYYLSIYHLTVTFIGLITSVIVGYTIYRVTHKWNITLLIVTILNVSPLWFGHLYTNPRDTVLASGLVLIQCFVILDTLERQEKKYFKYIFLSLGIFICLSVRLSSIGLIVIFLSIYLGMQVILNIHKKSIILKKALSLIIPFLSMTGLTYLTNPQIWHDPFSKIWRIFKSAGNFNVWKGDILLNGSFYQGSEAPWTYLPLYLLNQIPLGTILLLVFSSVIFIINRFAVKRDNVIIIFFILITTLVAPVYAILSGSVIYTGIRQFIFLVPMIALIVATLIIAVNHFELRYRKVIFAFTLYTILVILNEAPKYPVNYIYFNELNILRDKQFTWELDYWGVGEDILKRQQNSYTVILKSMNEPIYETNINTGEEYTNTGLEKRLVTKSVEINQDGLNNDCKTLSKYVKNFYFQKVELASLSYCSIERGSRVVDTIKIKVQDDERMVSDELYIMNRALGRSLCGPINLSPIENFNKQKINLRSKGLDSIYNNRHSMVFTPDYVRDSGKFNLKTNSNMSINAVMCFDGNDFGLIKDSSNRRFELYYGDKKINDLEFEINNEQILKLIS